MPSCLTPFPFLVDVEGNKAAIPGTGNTRVTLTHSTDVAKAVFAAFGMAKWEKRASYVVGETLTLSQLVGIMEDVKGIKYDVTYDSIEKLKEGKVTELPCYGQMYERVPKDVMDGLIAVFGLCVEEGVLDLAGEERGALNKEFPAIKTMSVREGIEQAWGPQNGK